MATITSSSLANQYQGYFSKKLLQHAVQLLKLNQFAQAPADLPENAGSLTISFFRRVAADAANVQTLTEGTPINTFTSVTFDKVSTTLAQIGEAAKITDVATMSALFEALKAGISLMGEDCALKVDTVIRNAIIAGITGAGQRRYAQQTADWATLAGNAVSAGKLVSQDILDAATQLAVKRAPTIKGDYVGILPPQQTRDIKNDPEWLKAKEYSDVKDLYNGEVGKLHGVRIVEATNPFIEDTAGAEGTYATSATPSHNIYSGIIVGDGCYGAPELKSGKTGNSSIKAKPNIIICDKADKSDPLNQFMTAGWKAMFNALVLNPSWGVVLKSKSAWNGV